MTATPDGPRGNDDDIDAEFSKIMEGFEFDESVVNDFKEEPPGGYREHSSTRRPEAPYEPGSVGSLTGPTPGRTSPEIPDDLSSIHDTAPAEDPNAPTPIAVIATPLASAKALAGVIRLALAAEDDRVAFPDAAVTSDAETGAIVTGPLSESEAHTVAHLVSLGLQRQGIVMFWRQGDKMIAIRYRNGQNEGETPPALVLGALSGEVEDLLLGVDSLADLEETYKPGELSRVEAMKWIALGRKKRK